MILSDKRVKVYEIAEAMDTSAERINFVLHNEMKLKYIKINMHGHYRVAKASLYARRASANYLVFKKNLNGFYAAFCE